MVDIRSEKWLWIKGGLFVVISLLSLGLLLLELSNTKQVVLVFVAIWACCRAYYFAFYVIEKYIDSRFRFAGLLYVPQYMWQRLQGTIPTEPTQARESPVLSWYVFWPGVFAVINFIVPSIYGLLYRAGFDRNEEFLSFFLAGAFATQIATVAVVSSSLRVPLKLAIPCSIGFIWFLATVFFVGCAFAGSDLDRESVLTVCLLSPVLFVLAIGLLSFTISLLGKQWSSALQNSSEASNRKKQLSIRYLFAATTVVAVLCVTLKASGIPFDFLTQGDFREIAMVFIFGSLPVVCLFLLLVVATLAAPSVKQGWMLYGASASLVATLPFIMYGSAGVAYWFFGKTFPSITMDELRGLYSFNGGFTISLLVMLLHARMQGTQLIVPKPFDASSATERQV